MDATKRDRSTPSPRMGAAVERVTASVYEVPTDARESDGTLGWDKTTVVVVHVFGGGAEGIGWTFAHGSASEIATGPLAKVVSGLDAGWISAAYAKMNRSIRNIGRPGLAWEALSAIDVALWDLRAKLLGMPLYLVLAPCRDSVQAYGSGGFTSYDDATLAEQLGRWSDDGFSAVKMKIGREPARDLHRVRVAREAIGRDVALMVDANGAWDRKQALAQMDRFARHGVTWVEEPVSSEDVDGLRLIRDRAPAGMEITTGEYGYVPDDFRRLLVADCLDVLQADGTRCGGLTGLLAVDAMCEAFHLPLSTHCAPLLHAHAACAMRTVRHIEYFHDHARIERLLFDGAVPPRRGRIAPDPSAPGLGVSIAKSATRFRR